MGFLAILLQVKWYYWVIGALAASTLIANLGWTHTSKALKQERTIHAQDIANFKTAQTLANQMAEVQRTQLIQESKVNAAKADASYATLLTQYRASLVRYRANIGSGSQANHNQLSTPQGGNGPSTSPQLLESITISLPDADICAVNTARLQAVHDWATSLPVQP